MNLWLIMQSVNTGCDTFDSAVVAAETEADARAISPEGEWRKDDRYTGWAYSPDQVTAKLIGTADASIEPGLVLASFNAG